MPQRSGRAEGIPYSMSRWTDVPAAKWPWFRNVMTAGKMESFDPHTGVPSWWSLAPEETLALVFWTKDPSNLIQDRDLFEFYDVKVHVTATGWHEVEKGAPNVHESALLLKGATRAFGVENVTWRFSPVPLLHANILLSRFSVLAEGAQAAGLKEVFVSFLQENDLMPETRSQAERMDLLGRMAGVANTFGITVVLCNDTARTSDEMAPNSNLRVGICVDPGNFSSRNVTTEACGCVQMTDPFTINESCTMGCAYCYAADKNLTPKKRNTTRSLPVLP